jgi:hypothetical protein
MTARFSHEVMQAATTDPITRPRLGRLKGTWYRIRFTVQEMNYAARRVTELQAPWLVDEQWHNK